MSQSLEVQGHTYRSLMPDELTGLWERSPHRGDGAEMHKMAVIQCFQIRVAEIG